MATYYAMKMTISCLLMIADLCDTPFPYGPWSFELSYTVGSSTAEKPNCV